MRLGRGLRAVMHEGLRERIARRHRQRRVTRALLGGVLTVRALRGIGAG